MRGGSSAVAAGPLLNALLNTASGATWVSIHHGGGVGIGYSQHAGVVIVCDGTPAAARRLERVLWNDPASGETQPCPGRYSTGDRKPRRLNSNHPNISDGAFCFKKKRTAQALGIGRAKN